MLSLLNYRQSFLFSEFGRLYLFVKNTDQENSILYGKLFCELRSWNNSPFILNELINSQIFILVWERNNSPPVISQN